MILFAPETWPFAAALALMLGLSVLEGIGLMMSHSPSHALDSLIPEVPEGIDGALGWLHLGRVPVLVLLILFLAGFALSGYLIQSLAKGMSGVLLPVWLAVLPSVFVGFSAVNGLGALIAKLIPRDESSAVTEASMIGRAGVIVRGTARVGYAAEAKVRDVNGRAHYLMVEPDMDEQTFSEGAAVLLVRKVGSRFRCIQNPHPELL
jgi:Protein of unknown function (DUF1449)